MNLVVRSLEDDHRLRKLVPERSPPEVGRGSVLRKGERLGRLLWGQGSGFRVQGPGFRVRGSGFRV